MARCGMLSSSSSLLHHTPPLDRTLPALMTFRRATAAPMNMAEWGRSSVIKKRIFRMLLLLVITFLLTIEYSLICNHGEAFAQSMCLRWYPAAAPNKKGNTSAGGQRKISRIGKDTPSVHEIREILVEERNMIGNPTGLGEVSYLANVYELTYALIAAFQRSGVPIFVGAGSHIGARRHHGIIPFGEKDIDLLVFSLDVKKVSSIITKVLRRKISWSRIDIIEREFGFQYGDDTNKQDIFKHYIDFWLFDNNGQDIKCIGRNGNGCEEWYRHFHAHSPPTFDQSDYFPPLYQVFGSHKVPIPSTTKELETFEYSYEDWNTTCGSHRSWSEALNMWEKVPKEKRDCSLLYDKYPFVFKIRGDKEELKQRGVVIHRSDLVA